MKSIIGKYYVIQVGTEDGEPFEVNEKYPHIVKYVSDDLDIFVVSADDPDQFWRASEFFLMRTVNEFEVIS